MTTTRATVIAFCVLLALYCGLLAFALYLSGCAMSHEDITPADLDAGFQCPEGWVPGNAAQPGECLRIAPGSPADGRVP